MATIRTRAAKGSELTHNELDANFDRTVSAKTTTYSCLVGDNRSLLECSHATTAFTVTLGDAATMAAAETGDYEITISNINDAVVTVAPAGTDTIDGSTADILLNKNQSVTLKVNSTTDGYISVNQFKHSETKYKTASTTRNSTTTFADDTHLAGWVLDIDTVYKITGFLLYNADSTPDIKFAIQSSQTPQEGFWQGPYATSAFAQDTIATSPTGFSCQSSAGSDFGMMLSGLIHTHATLSTTLDLQWAQATSDAGDSTLIAGSWITLEKLGNA